MTKAEIEKELSSVWDQLADLVDTVSIDVELQTSLLNQQQHLQSMLNKIK
tara:strand:- start:2229 stop:2378 length:150 start_codon:yes stop_codon:yes gene_type:complete